MTRTWTPITHDYLQDLLAKTWEQYLDYLAEENDREAAAMLRRLATLEARLEALDLTGR